MSEQSQSRKSVSCLVTAGSLLLGVVGIVFCLLGALIVFMNLVRPVTRPDGTSLMLDGILSSALFLVPAALLLVAALVVWLVSRRMS